MLELMDGFPAGVVAVRATEEVTAVDYEQVLVPAIDSVLATTTRCGSCTSWRRTSATRREQSGRTPGWGLRHFASFERIAVVTDAEWLRKAVPVFSVLIPGKIRAFSPAERDAATGWVAEGIGRSREGPPPCPAIDHSGTTTDHEAGAPIR